jgi:RNA polymerase sigma-70 factor (ECF subfamily)
MPFLMMNVPEGYIKGCLEGNPVAQRELYNCLLPYLNAICNRYLKNTSLRHDVLQESFIAIFKKIDQYNPELGAFHSWSSRIVINNCLKHNQSAKKFIAFKTALYEKTIEPEALSLLGIEDIERFLKSMPEKYYEVFMLFVVDGFDHGQIAEILGIKVELSRKRLARARIWIQERLERAGVSIVDFKYKTI